MPSLNEGAVVGHIVRTTQKLTELPVWLIDDCSTDNTRDEAEKSGARLISLHQKLGAWGATQTGLREAGRIGMKYVITMDADGQHNPKDIEKIMQPVLKGKADVAVGSSPKRGSLLRRIAWTLIRSSSGLECSDVTSGFRVFNRKAILLLASSSASNLDYQDVGVLLMLEKEGLTIVEVPVDMDHRKDGKSRIFSSWFAVISYMAQTLVLGIFKRHRAPFKRYRPKMVK
tara:strand:+ start:5617 stop:6303 length:687 start_codon:yes stop_codon:yes gene_type:complete